MRRVSLPNWKGNNTGGLLWGEGGCGKSQILSYVTAWAHEQNDWIQWTLSTANQFVDGTFPKIQRHENGLYLQNDLAKAILQDFKT
jgi:ABC-type dipeptide/oligopeptide/nickel transport system ATPase subunit